MSPISDELLRTVTGGLPGTGRTHVEPNRPRHEGGRLGGITRLDPGQDPPAVDSGGGFRRNPLIAHPDVQDTLKTLPRDL